MWKDIYDFIQFIKRNWQTFKSAWLAFIIVLLVGGIVGYLIGRWKYQRIVQIKNERIAQKDDQLVAKDDLIAEYRERLHLTPTTDTSYSRLTNNELKQKALEVVSQTRDFLRERNERDTRLRDSEWEEMFAAKSEEEKHRIWNKFVTITMESSQKLISDYKEKFKVDTILLRDELLSRLPKDARDDNSYSMYEHPINPIGMEIVATDLERLAKSLP